MLKTKKMKKIKLKINFFLTRVQLEKLGFIGFTGKVYFKIL